MMHESSETDDLLDFDFFPVDEGSFDPFDLQDTSEVLLDNLQADLEAEPDEPVPRRCSSIADINSLCITSRFQQSDIFSCNNHNAIMFSTNNLEKLESVRDNNTKLSSGRFQPSLQHCKDAPMPFSVSSHLHSQSSELTKPCQPLSEQIDTRTLSDALPSKDSGACKGEQRFKPFHEEKWHMRLKEFLSFVRENGHADMPHTYPENQPLARWVKRQRHQYKLLQDGRPSTMTAERIDLLSSVGFVWDAHEINWREKLCALKEYQSKHGHCNVPAKYKEHKLGTWVKCQRRQHKLYMNGEATAMNPDRIRKLENLGFEWEMRNAPSNKKPNSSCERISTSESLSIM